MSAFAATGLFSTVEQALSGPGVTIGGVGLTEMEVPERMPFGGTQNLAVHMLIGGQKVVDAMGPDDRPVAWSGLIRGTSAVSRARQLDAMRVAGSKVVLTWDDFVYTVVIQSFTPDYTRQGYRVPYQISCLIIPQPPVPPKPSLLQQLGSDISSALGIGGLSSEIQSAVTYARAALPVAAVLTGGGAAFTGLSSAVGAASGVLGAAQSISEAQVGLLAASAAPTGNLVGGTDSLGAIAALQDAGAATSSLASVVTAASYIGRAAVNLGSAGK